MEKFLEEINKLCDEYGITYKNPTMNEKIDFFKEPSPVTSTSLFTAGTFVSYHVEEVWSETTKELSIKFIKKTRKKVR